MHNKTQETVFMFPCPFRRLISWFSSQTTVKHAQNYQISIFVDTSQTCAGDQGEKLFRIAT